MIVAMIKVANNPYAIPFNDWIKKWLFFVSSMTILPVRVPPDFICIIAYFKRQGKGKMRNRSRDRANSPTGTFSFFRIYKTSDKKNGKI